MMVEDKWLYSLRERNRAFRDGILLGFIPMLVIVIVLIVIIIRIW